MGSPRTGQPQVRAIPSLHQIGGGDSPPRIIDSVALLIRVVGALPGALAYVREGFCAPDLKVVTLEGRLPSDARYPLTY
jgi:hypothetical protein